MKFLKKKNLHYYNIKIIKIITHSGCSCISPHHSQRNRFPHSGKGWQYHKCRVLLHSCDHRNLSGTYKRQFKHNYTTQIILNVTRLHYFTNFSILFIFTFLSVHTVHYSSQLEKQKQNLAAFYDKLRNINQINKRSINWVSGSLSDNSSSFGSKE